VIQYRSPYVPSVYSGHASLNSERDDNGVSRFWLEVDGNEIELTESQFQALLKERTQGAEKSNANDTSANVTKGTH
jgi:hypothetical protein